MVNGQKSGVPYPAPDSKEISQPRETSAWPAHLPRSVTLARSLTLSIEATILISAIGRYAFKGQSADNTKAIFKLTTFCGCDIRSLCAKQIYPLFDLGETSSLIR